MRDITMTKSYVEEECITCGVVFLIPTILQTHRQKDKKNFYCPNGHSMAYIKSTEDILREEIREKNLRLASKDSEINQLSKELREAKLKKKRK